MRRLPDAKDSDTKNLIFRASESSVLDKPPMVGQGCFPVTRRDAAQQLILRSNKFLKVR
jgi:hypothetical protein